MQNVDWDDLRFAAALAEAGSIGAAARRLGCDQTTVARRIAALEARLGARLFQRSGGLRLTTAAGETVLAHAATMSAAVEALQRQIGGEDAAPRGTVRVTTLDAFMAGFIAPRLGDFRQLYPEIRLELVGDSSNLSLTKREADVALRFGPPQATDLVARRLVDIGYALYTSARNSAPVGEQGGEQCSGPFIAYDEAFAHLPESEWLKAQMGEETPVLRSNNTATLRAALGAGIGYGVLPCYQGDADPTLRRVSGADPVVTRPLWLLIHRDLRAVTRVRAVADWLVATVAADAALLHG